MPKGIRHDAAKTAAYAAWELVTASPGATEETMLGKLTEIIKRAIEEADNRRAGLRRMLCLGCYRQLLFHPRQEGRGVKCPACGRKQIAPERIGRN